MTYVDRMNLRKFTNSCSTLAIPLYTANNKDYTAQAVSK